MVSSDLMGFYECIGLIPVYMGKITSNVLYALSGWFKSRGIDYSVLGFYSITVSDVKDRVVCGSILYKRYGVDPEVLDVSGLTYTYLSPTAPRQLVVVRDKEVKKTLQKILKIYNISEYKASTLLKPGVRCDKKNVKCMFSNYRRLVKGSAYLTLSVKCMGNTLQVKTAELADEILSQVFQSIVALVDNLLDVNRVAYRRDEVERMIAEKLYMELKWYIQKYYIDLPESLEKQEFYRLIT